MDRVTRLTKELKRYDRQLFAQKNAEGVISVYRKGYTYDLFEFNGQPLYVTRTINHHIFSLTHNWTTLGRPVEWGVLPIFNKLKAIDAWARPEMFKELDAENEKAVKSKERDYSNSVESFLRDFRRQFAKAFNDVNTSTLEKIDKRRIQDGISK